MALKVPRKWISCQEAGHECLWSSLQPTTRSESLLMDATGILWLLVGLLIFFGVLFWVVKTAVREGIREADKNREARSSDDR